MTEINNLLSEIVQKRVRKEIPVISTESKKIYLREIIFLK